jgi:hypothetical protein
MAAATALALTLVVSTAASAASRDGDQPLPGDAQVAPPVRLTVTRAREVTAEAIARAGVRPALQSDRPPVSAEVDEDAEEAERETRDRLFPPGAGTGRFPARPLGARQVESFTYSPAAAFDFDGPRDQQWTVADPQIAVSASHLVLAVNSRVEFRAKDSTAFYSDSISALLGLPAGYRSYFDPRLAYDEAAQRFYLCALTYQPALNISLLTIACSKSADPTQGWWVYDFRADNGNWALDYEDLGFGPRGVFVAGNYVNSFLSGPVVGTHTNTMFVLDKAALLAGNAVTSWQFTDVAALDGVLQGTCRVSAANGLPPAGLDGFMLGSQVRASEPTRFYLNVWGIALPGNFPASGPTLSRQSISTDYPGAPPNATQAGGSETIDASRLGAALLGGQYRNGQLATSANLGAGGLGIARGIGVRVSAWPSLSIDWQDDLVTSGSFYFYPGIALNNQLEAGVSVGYSSPLVFPSMRGAFKPMDRTTFYGNFTLRDGEAHFAVDATTSNQRWGDYGGAAVDPVSQNFWFLHMYASDTNTRPSAWKTRVALVPRAVYVDLAASPVGMLGTRDHPFTSVTSGQSAALPGNDLVIRAGTYPAGYTLSKPLRILADGGTVQIGP